MITQVSANQAAVTVERHSKAKINKADVQKSPDSFLRGESAGFFSQIRDVDAMRKSSRETISDDQGVGGILDKYGTELTGAAVGGTIGFAAGACAGYASAKAEIEKIPVDSVTNEWDKPVMRTKSIGEIPANYYQPNSIYGSYHSGSMQTVDKDVPVYGADGKPTMEHVSRTWTDHGKPVTEWKDRLIQDPILKGYHESVYTDSHYENVYAGTDSDGNAVYVQREEVDGFRHTFSPDIDYKTVGSFKEPEVHFETGVDMTGRILTYGAVGLIAGAGIGAFTAAVLKKSLAKAS